MSDPKITATIVKLARLINTSEAAEYVPVEPSEGATPGASFENVTEVVKRFSGSMQCGWILREQRNEFAEAKFHAVWRSRDGRLVDVTPRKDRIRRIIFLQDSRTNWDGQPIEPRRMSLTVNVCYCGSGMPFDLCHGIADA